ncbi:MAG TPA: hypothetical protein VK656_01890 [Candidatus Acidoferrum sp.]|nr:hypothetical protein [Candidatus Acidoferrum sp.]
MLDDFIAELPVGLWAAIFAILAPAALLTLRRNHPAFRQRFSIDDAATSSPAVAPPGRTITELLLDDVNDPSLATCASVTARSSALIRELDLVSAALEPRDAASIHRSFQDVLHTLRVSDRVVITATGTMPADRYTDAQVEELLRVGQVTIRPPQTVVSDERRKLVKKIRRLELILEGAAPFSPAWAAATDRLEETRAQARLIGVDATV